MLRNKYISPYNGIRFIPEGEIIAPRYNHFRFDEAWFKEFIYSFQDTAEYDQKIQRNDRLSLQILTSFNTVVIGGNAFAIEMGLYSCDGELVKNFTFDVRNDVPLFNGMRVQTFIDNEFWADVPSGEYYFFGTIGYDHLNTGIATIFDPIISERISVSERWDNTILHEYGNSYNKDDVCFDQTRQRFYFRVEGAVLNYEPLVERISFIDQGEITVPLYAKAIRGWAVVLGGDGVLIPDYAIDIANNVWTLDAIRVEGKGYVPATGAAFNKEELPQFPLYSASIEVRETRNPYLYTKGALVILDNIPGDLFVINYVNVGYVNDDQFSYTIPKMIFDSGDLDDYIIILNAQAATQGMTGSFVKVGNQVLYNLGTDENYDNGFGFYRTTALQVLVEADAAETITINAGLFAQTGTSFYSIFGNNGELLTYGNAITGGIVIPIEYDSPSAGIFIIYLWHDDNLNGILLSGTKIQSIDGDPPLTLSLFNINGSTKLTSFVVTGLLRCRASIQTLQLINNSNLNTVGGYYINPGNVLGWPVLKTIRFTGNSIEQSSVDAFFIQMNDAAVGGAPFPTFGTINISGQTPAAPPTSFSAAARLNLQFAYNWTLTTD